MTDPIARFGELFARAATLPRDQVPEPTAFALGTVDTSGQPSVRILLLKGFDERGFVFYTNHESRKGRELLATRVAAMCFHWPHLEMQVRIEGGVEPVATEEADAYFATRPRGSQIGAWASTQSRPMLKREELDARVAEFEKKFAGQTVPRPAHWSGFRLTPTRIEFWKGMASRLHHRDLYVRGSDGSWSVQILYP